MKLELKHIAPYLPYGLQVFHSRTKSDFTEIVLLTGEASDYILKKENLHFDIYKLILRSLHNFNDALEVEDFLGIDQWCDAYDEFFNSWFSDLANIDKLVLQAPQSIFNYFLANHFDVFGLIKQGLAVNVNSLKSEQ